MARHYIRRPDVPTCGAGTTDGGKCRRSPLKGRTRCALHGGKSPAGVNHPNWKHGKFANSFPARLQERAQEAESDPKLLELGRVLAMYDARLHDLGQRIDTGESGALWKALRKAWQDFKAAKRKKDPQATVDAEALLGAAIEKGHADNAAWNDIFEVFELRRVAVQTESRRRKELANTINAEQAMALVASVVEAVRRHVTDKKQLEAIRDELASILGRDIARPALPAGDG